MIKYYYKHIKNIKITYILHIFLCCLLWAMGIITPYIRGHIIDATMEAEMDFLIFNVAIFLLLTIFKVVFNYFQDRNRTKIFSVLNYHMNIELLERLQTSSLFMIEKKEPLESFQKNYKDIGILISFFVDTIITFVQNILTLIVLFFVLIRMDKLLLIFIFLKDRLYAKYVQVKILFSKYTSEIGQQYIHNSFIRANSIEKLCCSNLYNVYQKYKDKQLDVQKIDYTFNCLNAIFGFLSQLFIYVWGGLQVIDGRMSIGTLLTLVSYLDMMLSTMGFFLNMGKKYQNTMSSYRNISSYLNMTEIAQKVKDTKIILNNVSKISIINLNFSFGDRYIFKNLNLEFVKGSLYCIIGKNGIGKSTLLNLIIGLYDKCYSGMIKFDGYDIECLDLSHLRRNYFGIVEQSPIMLFESVRENLRFRETIADREIHFINMDDNDIDFINNNPRNLSGGEKQKIAFARQCYDEMSVLVMDEPTSMLDENAKRKMLKFLQKVKENRIVIIVSHDKQVMESCDYIINMECIAQT